jgi:hypothetical protein
LRVPAISVVYLPGKERAWQRGVVPAYAPAGVGDHAQCDMDWRKGVIEKLALTRTHLGSGVEK